MAEPELPLSRPPEMSRFTAKLRVAITAMVHRIGDFNTWSAAKLHTTRERIFQAEIGGLLAFGFTMMQIGEWAVAVACWMLLGFILAVKILAWSGFETQ